MADPAAGALATLAGLLVALGLAVLAGATPPRPRSGWPGSGLAARALAAERALAFAALGPRAGAAGAITAQLAPALAAAIAAYLLSGLGVLAAATGVAAAVVARAVLAARRGARRAELQDAVLDAVRLLRGLLESGGVGIQQALAVAADRGPAVIRADLAAIVAAGTTGRQAEAWRAARARIDDPLFDLLAAAVLAQRPGGGALGPLFADLEESVTALHEVVREAQALQLQARSAASLVAILPLVFLLVLGALRSPYLDAYRTPLGIGVLAALLTTIAGGYAWMLAWLRLPAEPRLEAWDA